MSFYEAFSLIGMLIGSFISGYVYDATNYVIIFGICAVIMLINLLYVIFFIEESVLINKDVVIKNDFRNSSHSFIKSFCL